MSMKYYKSLENSDYYQKNKANILGKRREYYLQNKELILEKKKKRYLLVKINKEAASE